MMSLCFRVRLVGFSAALLLLSACGRRIPEARQVPVAPSPDESYADLQAPSVLKIVVPSFRSGGFRAAFRSQGTTSGTSTVSSSDELLGYTSIQYSVVRRHGVVRLRWSGAQGTQNGRTTPLTKPPKLPFALPVQSQHIRLVYLVRASEADHNMAILASRDFERLQSFTALLKHDPAVCIADGSVFCTFVPSGIAVRVE